MTGYSLTEIRCHDTERADSAEWWAAHRREVPEPIWQPRGGQRLHCTWCGGLHPLDLLAALDGVAPRPFPEATCAHGGHSDVDDWRTCMEELRVIDSRWTGMRDQRWSWGWPHKFQVRLPDGGITLFYNVHLNDLPEREFQQVAALISRHTGIEFLRDEAGRLCFTTALTAPTGP